MERILVAEFEKTLGRPPHILVVDDEVFVRNSFQLYFETLGYQVSVADRGATALEVFSRSRPSIDVVLLDLVMPGLHGIDLLRRMKEVDGSVEIIIATGCGSMNSAIEALRYGAYDYITKPIVDFDEDLRKVVQEALQARTSRLASGSRGASRSEETDPSRDRTLEEFRALEALASESVSSAGGPEMLVALGTYIVKHLGVVGAIVVEGAPEGDVACVARWGAWARPQGPEGPRLAASQARKILPALQEQGRWYPLDLHEGDFAKPVRPDSAVTLEASRISLGPPGPKSGAVKDLVLLRSPAPGSSAVFTAPALLATVVNQALIRMAGTPSA